MRKIFTSIIIIVVLSFFMFKLLESSSQIMSVVSFSFDIFKNNIFPSLFPFFVLSHFLISYGFVQFISELFRPIMYKLFRVKGAGAFVFVMSLLSGFPSNSKYVRQLYLDGLINSYEGAKLLTFTHFSNPLFILGTVSLFLNKKVGILILVCHYFGNIVVGFLFRNYYISECDNRPVSFKKAILDMHNKRISNKSFGLIVIDAVKNGVDTLLLIFGIVTLFLIVTTIINTSFNFSSYYSSILSGIIEMTQGLKYVSLLDISLKIKGTLSVMFISFGGVSVHIQLLSILSDTDIKYFPFFIARIIHSCVSSLLFYFLFSFIHM